MVKNIVAALGKRIDALEWMSPQTKARAQQKLATLVVGIGYPDKWRDYSGLEIVRGDALGNAQRASKFEYQRNLAKLSQPVDRHEWFMVPHLVNALNSPQQNSIIFPAAILQPPFFDPNADPAVNYGGIGTVIGHEISHSFDDIGAMFDAEGKLANWWTPADLAKFKEAGAALAAQYSAYKPLPDVAVNGELTLGENIADVAGLATSHDAYLASLGGKPGRDDRRLHPRAALLPRLRAGLAQPLPRARAPAAAAHRRPLAGPAALGDRAQPRRLVRGVRGEAGAGALPAPGAARPRLVAGGRGPQWADARALARCAVRSGSLRQRPGGIRSDRPRGEPVQP